LLVLLRTKIFFVRENRPLKPLFGCFCPVITRLEFSAAVDVIPSAASVVLIWEDEESM
jgi:hypothetical protein